MRLIAVIAFAVLTLAASPRTAAAGEEPTSESELLAAYCIGVFSAETRSQSFLAPSCLTNEADNDCLARNADIDLERHRIDRTLRRLQGSLAAEGIVTPPRYLALAKYLVATSCWDGN
jgi:hypothetical protein